MLQAQFVASSQVIPLLSLVVSPLFCFFFPVALLVSTSAAIGVVGGVGALIVFPLVIYFCFRWRRKQKEKGLQGQWDSPGGYDARWKMPPHSPASPASPTSPTHSQSFSTGPALSNLPSQPYVSFLSGVSGWGG